MINGVIKVVDNLESVDTSVPDPTLPAPSTGPSCCARPIDEGADYSSPSIYGNDISKVPTEILIGKSENNMLTVKGIGYEFKPLVSVAERGGTSTIIAFDFTDFYNPDGRYAIVDGYTGKTIWSLTEKKG